MLKSRLFYFALIFSSSLVMFSCGGSDDPAPESDDPALESLFIGMWIDTDQSECERVLSSGGTGTLTCNIGGQDFSGPLSWSETEDRFTMTEAGAEQYQYTFTFSNNNNTLTLIDVQNSAATYIWNRQ